MGFSWSDLTGGEKKKEPLTGQLSARLAGNARGRDLGKDSGGAVGQRPVENRPIEPEGSGFGKAALLRWVIFVLIILYMAVNFFHSPILERVGRFLVVEDSLRKADLIVCLMGSPLERGLSAADLFEQGYAPGIFVAREKRAAGHEELSSRGAEFPERRDLVLSMLRKLGVPPGALVTNQAEVESTFEEALSVGQVVREKGLKRIIVVTSPTHTKRALLTFRKVLEQEGTEVVIHPSRYSDFDPGSWWKSRRHAKEVFLEYQKLVYYFFIYLG